ncbi:Oxidoreductase HTATIP2 [Symbiodinium microadriaticum]|uniref:Oxidoreductase HTATIP2 n=1 Tax=Symbiodinium microadriaticum TaxID=2951 RepID=A0A1Q9C254_SYMMI|nr:Oxidoreductase HTATIP2 [Symbiodinium microadriaticum]
MSALADERRRRSRLCQLGERGKGMATSTHYRAWGLAIRRLEVHTLVRRKTSAFKELSAAAKLHQHIADFRNDDCGVEASALDGVDAAFCVLGARSGWSDAADVAAVERDAVINFARLCEARGVPHFSLLSSVWADPKSNFAFGRLQGEALEAVAKMDGFKRVSIFRPSAAKGPDGQLASSSGPFLGGLLWRSLPVASQFMHNRYRPMALEEIVLAMRLNVELCDASEKVERLEYRDMMMIIGKDSDL